MELIVRREGREEKVRIRPVGGGYELAIGDRSYRVEAAAVGASVRSLLVDGRQFEVRVRPAGNGTYEVGSSRGWETVQVLDPLAHLAEKAHRSKSSRGQERVTAYMPGRVVTVLVAEGEEVQAGQGLVVLEAMKMENEIQAERAGVVRRVLVAPGEAVEGGDPLFEIE